MRQIIQDEKLKNSQAKNLHQNIAGRIPKTTRRVVQLKLFNQPIYKISKQKLKQQCITSTNQFWLEMWLGGGVGWRRQVKGQVGGGIRAQWVGVGS